MTGELSRIAVHEAGHSFAAWHCGRAPGPVSVKPGRRWLGTSHYGAPAIHDRELERVTPSLPVPCWPAALRRKIEVRALVTAAGAAAEQVLWLPAAVAARSASRPGDTIEGQAADAIEALAATPARREELLLAADRADTGDLTDAQKLAAYAAVLYLDNGEAAMAWLSWVAAEARAIVTAGAGPVLRLAAELERHGSLSGRGVKAILAANS